MIGRTVGNFRIVEKLGEGGMGSVYRAVDLMVQRNVAIKLLKPGLASNPDTYERFHTEAVALARLNHPAIATLYSFFREGEQFFMVMEYVPGKNLEQVIRSSGALGWQPASGILLRVLEGLQHAHAQGILHRDLKPANIMLTPEGGVKITDFGIARVFYAPKLTRDAQVIGTLEYLAPERVLGQEADARSDVYSLGIVFYEMVSGRLPFSATSDYALMRAHLQDRPKPVVELGVSMPSSVEHSMMLALEKEPEKRHRDAGSFAEHLRAAVLASGIEFPDLAGAIPVGARETAAVAVPKPTVSAAPPREIVFVEPPRETACAAPAMPMAPPPPTAPAASGGQRERAGIRPGILWAIPGAALALALGVVGFWHFSRPRHPPSNPSAVVPAAPAPPPAAGAGGAYVPVAPVPPPSVKPPAPAPQDKKPPAPPSVQPPAPGPAKPPVPEETSEPPAVSRLADVKRLYLQPGPADFDGYLRDQLHSELGGRLQLAASAAEADAVLHVLIQDQRGNPVFGAAGRVVGLKGTKKAIATIQDRSGKRQLWQAEVDDRHSIVAPMRDDMKRLASRLAKRLRADLP
ncbi:MAG: serine/threonine-protein kinase [Bryobacteraceae bacterium]|jgi:serine/threonine-protein kinase